MTDEVTPDEPAQDETPATTTPNPLLLPIDETQPLIIHARAEAAKSGLDDLTLGAYLQAIQGFLNMQLDNTTAIPDITKLLNMENLSPLTDDPAEWEQGEVFWWSTRNHNAFSRDGGKTYFILGEQTVHKSVTNATSV